jgi:hypothetical protein
MKAYGGVDWDSNSDPSVVQPIASHYTDYSIPAPIIIINGA